MALVELTYKTTQSGGIPMANRDLDRDLKDIAEDWDGTVFHKGFVRDHPPTRTLEIRLPDEREEGFIDEIEESFSPQVKVNKI